MLGFERRRERRIAEDATMPPSHRGGPAVRCPKGEPHVSFSGADFNFGTLTVIVGRYVIGETFASGGMGTVHLGRILGAGGFSRIVAVKRLYPWLARDGEFRQMLLDEARCVSRIRHPNVVPTLDVVEADKDLYVVMEYVHGVSLAHLLKHCEKAPIPVSVAAGILEGVLSGLHAAHEARGEDGSPLGVVHRDVSPQNILVGADGIARLIDFGIAKAATRLQVTDPGVVKGKIGYMAPEQLVRGLVTRHADVYSCGVVLWEALANRRLGDAHGEEPLPRRIHQSEDVPPSRFSPSVSAELESGRPPRVVRRAEEPLPDGRGHGHRAPWSLFTRVHGASREMVARGRRRRSRDLRRAGAPRRAGRHRFVAGHALSARDPRAARGAHDRHGHPANRGGRVGLARGQSGRRGSRRGRYGHRSSSGLARFGLGGERAETDAQPG